MGKNRGGGRGKAPSNIEGIKNPKTTIAYIEGQLERFEVELASMPTGSVEWCKQLARIDKKKSKLRLAWKHTPRNLRTKLNADGKIVSRDTEE
jgi:hypothetical protein